MLMSHQGSHDNSVSTRRRARHSSRPLVCRSRDAGTSRDLELVSRCTLHTACSDCAWLTPVSLSMVLGTHTRHAKNDHTTPTPTSAPPTPHRLPPPASPPTSLFAEQPTRLHHAHDGGSVAATEAPTSPLHSSHHDCGRSAGLRSCSNGRCSRVPPAHAASLHALFGRASRPACESAGS